MHKTLLLTVSMMCLITGPVEAKTYRWVDDSGNVVYSQSPPPDDRAAQTIKPPPPPPSGEAEKTRKRIEERLKSFDERTNARREAQQKAEEERDSRNEKKRNCRNARENVRAMSNHSPNNLYRLPNGEYKRFTAEEWQREIDKAGRFVRENCN